LGEAFDSEPDNATDMIGGNKLPETPTEEEDALVESDAEELPAERSSERQAGSGKSKGRRE
jgi:hypothetical protein